MAISDTRFILHVAILFGLAANIGYSREWKRCSSRYMTGSRTYTYTLVKELKATEPFTFDVSVCTQFFVALSNSPNFTGDMYEVFIGGFMNPISAIRDRMWGENTVQVPTPVEIGCYGGNEFWISYKNGKVRIGTGLEVGKKRYMKRKFKRPYQGISYVGIHTGFGASGDWCFEPYMENVDGV